jgi:uncharacterized protein YxeA
MATVIVIIIAILILLVIAEIPYFHTAHTQQQKDQ